MTSERFESDNIQEILDKYKDKINVGDYLRLSEIVKETGDYQLQLHETLTDKQSAIQELEKQLTKATEKIEDLEEENMSLGFQLAETTKPHCIKCGESMGHDGRGWMRLNKSSGDGDVIDRNKLYLCASCILKGQAVKDLKEYHKIK